MKNIIVANWKMNNSFDEAEKWLEDFNKKIQPIKKAILPDIALCPPAILLDYLDELLMEEELNKLEAANKNIEDLPEEELERLTLESRKIHLGGQDCHAEEKGAFTGDINSKQLKDTGCKYVILGHSERRQHHLESDELINKKILTALKNKLIPIFCIGESKEVRGKKTHLDFIKSQIENSIPEDLEIEELIIAYEPIWSIGTGTTPTIAEIQEVSNFIKETVEINKNFKIKSYRILYGGSTNKENCSEILNIPAINGLLAGGASLKPDEFSAMIQRST